MGWGVHVGDARHRRVDARRLCGRRQHRQQADDERTWLLAIVVIRRGGHSPHDGKSA